MIPVEDPACVDSQSGDTSRRCISFADYYLTCAHKSENARLMRHVVKDLGVVGDSRKMGSILKQLQRFEESKYIEERNLGYDFFYSTTVPSTQYECAACETGGANERCTGSKQLR